MQPLDITDRIREHAERLDAEASPVLFTDLRGPQIVPLTDTDALASRPLHGWMVAAASAIAVLLIVGGSIGLLNLVAEDSESEAVAVATTVAAPATTSVTSITVAPQVPPPATPALPQETAPTSWTRVDTEMAAVSADSGPFGIIALDRHNLPDVLLWSSLDGMTWSNSDWVGSAGTDPMGSSVDTVTHAGSRYFVFGGQWGIELWSSIDGVDWVAADHIDDGDGPDERVGPGDPPPGTYSQFSQITYGNDMYVAVGDVRDHGEEGYSNPRAAAWTSSDAMTWERLPENNEVFDGPWHQEMLDVVFGDSGFVAVGSTDGDDGGSSVGAIWHSQDGISWTRIAHDEALFGEQTPDEWRGLWSVAYGDGMYVAVGTGPRVLTSDDGLTWTPVATDGFNIQAGLIDVAFGDGSFVVVGTDSTPSEDAGDVSMYIPAIWHSTDAVIWERVTDDNDLFGGPFSTEDGGGSLTVTFGDGRFVAVGYDQVWSDSGGWIQSGHAWIGEPTP